MATHVHPGVCFHSRELVARVALKVSSRQQLPGRKSSVVAPSTSPGRSGEFSRKCAAVRCVLQPTSRPPTSFPPSSLTENPFEPEGGTGTLAHEDGWRVVPDIWATTAKEFPDSVAVFDPHRPQQPKLTFKQLHYHITCFAEGLKSLGLGRGENVALLSENSHRWLIADQGVMMCGAADAVRGTRSSPKELEYIVVHSDSAGVIVETEEVLEKIRPLLEDEQRCPPLKFLVVLWPESEGKPSAPVTRNGSSDQDALGKHSFRFPVVGFQSVIDEGRSRLLNPELLESNAMIREDDIATLVFTSGTTGEPKAVMLTHANLMHQIRAYPKVLPFECGEVLLSLLPPWHMYERSCEYYALSKGAQQIYSGVKTFKEDLIKHPPDFFVAVPLVFEVLYSGVQRKLAAASEIRAAIANWLITASLAFMENLRKWRGLALPDVGHTRMAPVGTGHSLADVRTKALADVIMSGVLALLLWPLHLLASKVVYSKVKAAVPIRKVALSGGGSLAPHVDKFFEAMGLTVLNGYGLTETSPVLTVRRTYSQVLGTVGTPIHDTQIKVVDPETGATLPDGMHGIVKGKGPQVMKGYYKNPAATAAVIDAEGWFDTGDIGYITPETSAGPARNSGRQLVLEGRAKDTIVLANGENVEPAWVEEAALRSPAISQIMLIGQDQRRLAALIVPSKEELDSMVLTGRTAKEPTTAESGVAVAAPVTDAERHSVIRDELTKCLRAAGCGYNERIGHFALLDEPFTIENGLLTATMKMRRDVIYKKYEGLCTSLFE